MRFRHIATCDNVRHLWVQNASARVVRSTFLMFPRMESIKDPVQREVFKIFGELHLPVLRKLTFVADQEESEITCIVAALEITSCDVQVVDSQTAIPLSEVDVDVVELLFSIAREVTIHGEVLCRPIRQ
ncbi:hypothetical protein EDB19DRAFT_1914994 [Suillus lakei]|nr:hypothetical protein EDB19DRAFT_1914994 [Suillus lakei]